MLLKFKKQYIFIALFGIFFATGMLVSCQKDSLLYSALGRKPQTNYPKVINPIPIRAAQEHFNDAMMVLSKKKRISAEDIVTPTWVNASDEANMTGKDFLVVPYEGTTVSDGIKSGGVNALFYRNAQNQIKGCKVVYIPDYTDVEQDLTTFTGKLLMYDWEGNFLEGSHLASGEVDARLHYGTFAETSNNGGGPISTNSCIMTCDVIAMARRTLHCYISCIEIGGGGGPAPGGSDGAGGTTNTGGGGGSAGNGNNGNQPVFTPEGFALPVQFLNTWQANHITPNNQPPCMTAILDKMKSTKFDNTNNTTGSVASDGVNDNYDFSNIKGISSMFTNILNHSDENGFPSLDAIDMMNTLRNFNIETTYLPNSNSSIIAETLSGDHTILWNPNPPIPYDPNDQHTWTGDPNYPTLFTGGAYQPQPADYRLIVNSTIAANISKRLLIQTMVHEFNHILFYYFAHQAGVNPDFALLYNQMNNTAPPSTATDAVSNQHELMAKYQVKSMAKAIDQILTNMNMPLVSPRTNGSAAQALAIAELTTKLGYTAGSTPSLYSLIMSLNGLKGTEAYNKIIKSSVNPSSTYIADYLVWVGLKEKTNAFNEPSGCN